MPKNSTFLRVLAYFSRYRAYGARAYSSGLYTCVTQPPKRKLDSSRHKRVGVLEKLASEGHRDADYHGLAAASYRPRLLRVVLDL